MTIDAEIGVSHTIGGVDVIHTSPLVLPTNFNINV